MNSLAMTDSLLLVVTFLIAIGAKYPPSIRIAAGLFADKIGPAKAILGFCIIMTLGFFIFALIPGSPALLTYLIINNIQKISPIPIMILYYLYLASTIFLILAGTTDPGIFERRYV